ncbi:magnesium transporter CorA family protein [Patescibacteria group bacterium]|nr:magnesium transporter CorA family protein [Patescibacteria group bacterium]MBU2036393.1 magnesium transporter CorA family protein [Patescibacteria group bacterium]
MINFYFKTIRDRKIKRIARFKSGCWIRVYNPSDKELETLEKRYSLEKGHLIDALDPYEVPRIETENGSAYIFTRYPIQPEKNGKIITIPLLIVVCEDFILTLSSEDLQLKEKLFKQDIDFSTTQRTKFTLQILFNINHTFNKFLNTISRDIRKTNVDLEKINIKNSDIIRLVGFETILNDFLSALEPIKGNISMLTSGKILELFEEDKDLIEDLLLNNNQLIGISKSNLKNIVNIREAYSTIMGNNLNKIIKFLTALTVVLNIPVLISGFYGMNVALPLAQSGFAFWYLVFSSVIISIILIIVFIKMDWF